MKNLKRKLCAALAAGIVCLSFASCGEKKQSIDITNIKFTDEQKSDARKKIETALSDSDFSGGAYVNLNGDILCEKYIGFEDEAQKTKISKTTRYQVSSLTKNITGICILQLADEGKLSLGDTLDKYFPATDNHAYIKKITIGQLLSRETSFGTYNSELIHDEKKFEALRQSLKKGTARQYITEHILDTGETKSNSLAHSNYYLLGIIIEKASGEDYKNYIKKNIFDKIGMSESEVVSFDRPLSGYNVDEKAWWDENHSKLYNCYEFMFSSFGVTSTMSDMIKFYNAIMSNKLTKSNLIEKIDEFVTSYGYGFGLQGKDIYSYGGTSLHTSFVYINTETKELVLLCSNQSGEINLDATGKKVYNAVNSEINGMLLDN